MNKAQATSELVWLLEKISTSEDFIERAEEYFNEKSDDWPYELAVSFEKFLERKREQIYFEREVSHNLGLKIALGKYPPGLDI